MNKQVEQQIILSLKLINIKEKKKNKAHRLNQLTIAQSDILKYGVCTKILIVLLFIQNVEQQQHNG